MKPHRVRRKRRPVSRGSRWTVRYALAAYLAVLGVGIVVAVALTGSDLRLGLGVFLVDAAMLTSLLPLGRARQLTVRDLGLRRASPAASVGKVLLALIAVAIINGVWNQECWGIP